MAEVLCVYREVTGLKAGESADAKIAFISYDEKLLAAARIRA